MPGVEDNKTAVPISLSGLEGFLTGEFHDGGKTEKKAMSKTEKVFFILTFPFVFIFLPIIKYVIPCIFLTLHKLILGNCCRLLPSICTYRYTDDKFCGQDAMGNDEKVEWKRVTEICNEEDSTYLFDSEIDVKDVAQGALGDCWLISALACLAEFPGGIQSIFITRERSYVGYYTVKLWCNYDNKWRHITVDDKIPTQYGRPIYCHTNANQKNTIWSLILEKAFAKYCGSYEALTGGHVVWALQAMTGDKVIMYRRNGDGKWAPSTIKPGSGTADKPRDISWTGVGNVPSFDDTQFFDQLVEFDRKRAVIGAGTKHKEDDGGRQDTKDNANHGIVAGHAYTIKAAVQIRSQGQEFRMLQLRNPWGSFEWDGAWSDKSSMWADHPSVSKACKRVGIVTDAEDGLFWMEMGDFVRYYAHVDVCYRKVGTGDHQLNVHEEDGIKGSCVGCMEGVANWYCCCGGVDALCFPIDYKEGEEQQVHKGMCASCTRKASDCVLMQSQTEEEKAGTSSRL
jgi:calpain-15